MKTIILILLFTNSVFAAGNWFPIGKNGAKTIYTQNPKCEMVEGQKCFDITNKDPRFHETQTSMVDDPSKPIMKAPYNSINCDSSNDCNAKILDGSITCIASDNPSYVKNPVLPGFTMSCTGIAGYEQMQQTILVENAALKTSVQAADATKATQESAMAVRMKRIGFGVQMIAFIGIRNDEKSLSEAQSVTFLTTFAPIMQLLQAGALDTAKVQIEGITPDGVLTTQADKDAILAEINAFIGL